MKTLITGAYGFTGKHLLNNLEGEAALISRTKRDTDSNGHKNITLDMTDYRQVNSVIQEYKPEKIFHLAGSFHNDFNVDYPINVLGTKNIFDSIVENKLDTRVLVIGSAAEFGYTTFEQNPVSESTMLNPFSDYGLTKVFQSNLMKLYCNKYGLDIVMARPFNLYGKGVSDKLFVGRVYSEIEKFKRGEIEHITLGNLNSQRDYIHISEATKHYLQIMKLGKKGEVYNVGTGTPKSTRDLLVEILTQEGLNINIVKSNENFLQQNDSDQIYADISKLRGLYEQ